MFHRLWVFRFRYLTSLFSFFFSPSKLGIFFVFEGCKGIIEGRKETKIGDTFYISTLFVGFIWLLCCEEMSSWTNSCVSQIRCWNVLVILVVWNWSGHVHFFIMFVSAVLAHSQQTWLGIRLQDLISTCSLQAAAWKRVHSVLWWSEVEFLFCTGMVLSLSIHCYEYLDKIRIKTAEKKTGDNAF